MMPIVKGIVRNLVAREFSRIAEEDVLKLMNAQEILEAVDDYPGVMTMPPDEAFDKMDVYGEKQEWGRIDMDLWYDNAQSDVTLSCKILRREQGLDYGIESIHIL